MLSVEDLRIFKSIIYADIRRCFYSASTFSVSAIANWYLKRREALLAVPLPRPVCECRQVQEQLSKKVDSLLMVTDRIKESMQKTNQIMSGYIEHQYLLLNQQELQGTSSDLETIFRRHDQSIQTIKNFRQVETFINFAYIPYEESKAHLIDTSSYEISERMKIGDIWLEVSRYCDFIKHMELIDFHNYCKIRQCDFTRAEEFVDSYENLVRKLWVVKKDALIRYMADANH